MNCKVRILFQSEDGIRDSSVTGVQTCALPISGWRGLRIAPGELRLHPIEIALLDQDRDGNMDHRRWIMLPAIARAAHAVRPLSGRIASVGQDLVDRPDTKGRAAAGAGAMEIRRASWRGRGG